MARYETEVVENDGAFDATCDDTVLGEPCFRTTGWVTEEQAKNRIREHLYEHAEGVPSREIAAFELGMSQEDYEVRVAEIYARNQVVTPDEGGNE